MTYPTIDSLPDLTTQQMATAQTLTFQPYTGAPSAGWDLQATYTTSEKYAILKSIFSWTAVAGVKYDMLSFSFYDPYLIEVFDNLGNVVAVGDKESVNDSAILTNFIAPYSGTFYVEAGWHQGVYNLAVGVGIYADVDTVPKPSTLPNNLTGTAGNDRLVATSGNDNVNGGDGIDTLNYAGNRSSYKLVKQGDVITITSKLGAEGIDTVRNVEQVQFADKTVDVRYNDLTQSLYIGYFGRAADPGGLTNFQSQLSTLGAPMSASELSARYATDASVKSLIDSFGLSNESKALYSGDTKSFVKAIFNNVLNRDPAQGGLDFWSTAIDAGTLTRANASLSIMAGAQTNTTAQGLADKQLVDNKISVASNFTFGLDTPEKSASYAGSTAAAAARSLLSSVNSTTDIAVFQATVEQAVGKLPVPRSAPDHADESMMAQADNPAIHLVGLDGGSVFPF